MTVPMFTALHVDKEWQVYRYSFGGSWWVIHTPCYGSASANSLTSIESEGFPPCNNCHTLLGASILKKMRFIEKSD